MLIYKFDLFQQYAPCAFFSLFCVLFSRKNEKNSKKKSSFFFYTFFSSFLCSMLGCHGLFETHVFFFFGPCSNRCTYTRNTHTHTKTKTKLQRQFILTTFSFFFCFFSFLFFGFRVAQELSFFFCARLFLPTLFPLLFSKGMERRGEGVNGKR